MASLLRLHLSHPPCTAPPVPSSEALALVSQVFTARLPPVAALEATLAATLASGSKSSSPAMYFISSLQYNF